MYDVQLSSKAGQFYQDADQALAKRITRCLEQLEHEPRRHNNIKRLTGPFSGFLRFRIGDWRVIYTIDDSAMVVRVYDICHRRDAYE